MIWSPQPCQRKSIEVRDRLSGHGLQRSWDIHESLCDHNGRTHPQQFRYMWQLLRPPQTTNKIFSPNRFPSHCGTILGSSRSCVNVALIQICKKNAIRNSWRPLIVSTMPPRSQPNAVKKLFSTGLRQPIKSILGFCLPNLDPGQESVLIPFRIFGHQRSLHSS